MVELTISNTISRLKICENIQPYSLANIYAKSIRHIIHLHLVNLYETLVSVASMVATPLLVIWMHLKNMLVQAHKCMLQIKLQVVYVTSLYTPLSRIHRPHTMETFVRTTVEYPPHVTIVYGLSRYLQLENV